MHDRRIIAAARNRSSEEVRRKRTYEGLGRRRDPLLSGFAYRSADAAAVLRTAASGADAALDENHQADDGNDCGVRLPPRLGSAPPAARVPRQRATCSPFPPDAHNRFVVQAVKIFRCHLRNQRSSSAAGHSYLSVAFSLPIHSATMHETLDIVVLIGRPLLSVDHHGHFFWVASLLSLSGVSNLGTRMDPGIA